MIWTDSNPCLQLSRPGGNVYTIVLQLYTLYGGLYDGAKVAILLSTKQNGHLLTVIHMHHCMYLWLPSVLVFPGD